MGMFVAILSRSGQGNLFDPIAMVVKAVVHAIQT